MFKWIRKLLGKPDCDPILTEAVCEHSDLCIKYGYESKEAMQFAENHKYIPNFTRLSNVTVMLQKLYGKTQAIE